MPTVTLDDAGRVVIPKSLRDELGMVPGDRITVESDGDRVTIRPLRSASPMHKERDIWVFRSGQQISATETDNALCEVRRGRAGRNSGT
jgi:AbrB family looped-hinge helix DNA binding protein